MAYQKATDRFYMDDHIERQAAEGAKKREGMKHITTLPPGEPVTAMCLYKDYLFIAIGPTIYRKAAGDDSPFEALEINYIGEKSGN